MKTGQNHKNEDASRKMVLRSELLVGFRALGRCSKAAMI
jgi:hypothetical protein